MYFFKKTKEKHLEISLHLCTENRDRVRQTEIGNYGSFFPLLLPPKK